jgi:hypothetical protein
LTNFRIQHAPLRVEIHHTEVDGNSLELLVESGGDELRIKYESVESFLAFYQIVSDWLAQGDELDDIISEIRDDIITAPLSSENDEVPTP